MSDQLKLPKKSGNIVKDTLGDKVFYIITYIILGLLALIILYAGINMPMSTFIIRGFMETFPVELEEAAAIELTQRIAVEFAPVDVHISHVGLFAGGRVLFAAPEMNPALAALQKECSGGRMLNMHPFTPHTTMLIDSPETICRALPVLMEKFEPCRARLIRLHLCAFWPTREIINVELTGNR